MTEQEKIDQLVRKLIVAVHDQASDNEALRPDQVTHFTNYREFHASATATIQQLLDEARVEGMKAAKSRVLRRTEIPKDAKNPTRDATVLIGEAIADIIDGDIAALTANEKKEK